MRAIIFMFTMKFYLLVKRSTGFIFFPIGAKSAVQQYHCRKANDAPNGKSLFFIIQNLNPGLYLFDSKILQKFKD